jgi:hypothetical protein
MTRNVYNGFITQPWLLVDAGIRAPVRNIRHYTLYTSSTTCSPYLKKVRL